MEVDPEKPGQGSNYSYSCGNSLWLQRLLTRFQPNSQPEIVNPDQWFSCLLDQPVRQPQNGSFRPHVPGTGPAFNQIPSTAIISKQSKNIELQNLLEQFESSETNRVSTSSTRDEVGLEVVLPNTPTNEPEFTDIRTNVPESEEMYNRKRDISTSNGISDHDASTWTDTSLRLNKHLLPNASASNTWMNDLLGQSSSIPSKIPKTDF